MRGTVRGDASEIRKHAREEKKGRVSVRVCVFGRVSVRVCVGES